MDLKDIMVGFLVFGIFIIALISFGVNFANENDAETLVTDNNSPIQTIYSGVNSTIYNYDGNNIQEKANDSFGGFHDEGDTTGILGTITDFFISSLLAVGKTITGISNAIFNVTLAPLLKALGIQPGIARIIGIVVSTIMLFTLILLAWKLYRLGY